MKRILFVSLLADNYSRSAVLKSSLEKSPDFEVKYYRIPSSTFMGIFRYLAFLLITGRQNDIIIIMSPGHILVPITKIVFCGIVILDAGWPLSDSSEIRKGKKSLTFFKDNLIDRFCMRIADLVILESERQKESLRKRNFRFSNEPKVIYTGVLDKFFQKREMSQSSKVEKTGKLRVIFRGKYNKEAGLEFIQSIFESRLNRFDLVICCSNLPGDFVRLPNVIYHEGFLHAHKIATFIRESDLALGQFGCERRIERSIPHKIFEYASHGIPVVCMDGSASGEIFSEREFFYVKRYELGLFLDSTSSDMVSFQRELITRSKRINEKYLECFSEKSIRERFRRIIAELR